MGNSVCLESVVLCGLCVWHARCLVVAREEILFCPPCRRSGTSQTLNGLRDEALRTHMWPCVFFFLLFVWTMVTENVWASSSHYRRCVIASRSRSCQQVRGFRGFRDMGTPVNFAILSRPWSQRDFWRGQSTAGEDAMAHRSSFGSRTGV